MQSRPSPDSLILGSAIISGSLRGFPPSGKGRTCPAPSIPSNLCVSPARCESPNGGERCPARSSLWSGSSKLRESEKLLQGQGLTIPQNRPPRLGGSPDLDLGSRGFGGYSCGHGQAFRPRARRFARLNCGGGESGCQCLFRSIGCP